MIDFHSHILPQMDDGSRDSAESLLLLRSSMDQDIDTLIASSHYYRSKEGIPEFLSRRQKSLEQLMEAAGELKIPEIHLGAEVSFFSGMSKLPELELLKIQGTDCILIEMPFSTWTSATISEIYSIFNNRDLTPILAHVERYPDFLANSSKLDDLIDMGALFQINGEFINIRKSRRRALDLLKHGNYYLLGSDCHNMDQRPPNLGEAMAIIEKKLGLARLGEIERLGSSLFVESDTLA